MQSGKQFTGIEATKTVHEYLAMEPYQRLQVIDSLSPEITKLYIAAAEFIKERLPYALKTLEQFKEECSKKEDLAGKKMHYERKCISL